jgi:hypothetical protein
MSDNHLNDKYHFSIFKPYRLGFLLGIIYLLVAVPCSFMHWYEYSIPLMIVHYASLPIIFCFYGLKSLGVRIPYMNKWLFRSILLISQTTLYFLLAEGFSFLFRKLRN